MQNEQSGHSNRGTNAKLKELCYILVLDLFLGDNFLSLKLTQISYKRGGQDRKKRLFEASHYEPVSNEMLNDRDNKRITPDPLPNLFLQLSYKRTGLFI